MMNRQDAKSAKKPGKKSRPVVIWLFTFPFGALGVLAV
jgi:hypothetical protein